jgi:hypothetical protein
MTTWARRALLGLLYFGAISALAGGVLGVAANGAGVPLTYLQGTPFTSYLIPGLILGLIVGGTQGLGAIAIQRRHPHGPLAAAVAGFGMTIWIFVEVAITGYSWLQAVYLAVGIGELALVFVLLGILPITSTPPDPLAARAGQRTAYPLNPQPRMKRTAT